MDTQKIIQRSSQHAMGLGITFLVLLGALHFLEPEFDPTWRMISEYELGSYGYLMRIAFFCWGGGFLSFVISIWYAVNTRGGKIAKWWLLIISIGLFGAGIFAPNPITEIAHNTGEKIHSICGVLMIFTFPIVASLFSRNLPYIPELKTSHRTFFWLTLLVWVGFFYFFGSIIMYAPKNRAYNAEVLIGLPNRFMVVSYTIWLVFVARIVHRNLGEVSIEV